MSSPGLAVLVGTKAQLIKTAPVLRELDRRRVPYRLIYTGQHSETFELLESAFGTRGPDDVLVPGSEAATHGRFARWCLDYWIAVLRRLFRREWRGVKVGLVHGDTASTLFGALALRLAGARVAHVEAGLRSPRLMEPFPEEIVRRLVSKVSWWHFAPDAQALSNLAGLPGIKVQTGGNTLRDALALALRGMGELSPEGGRGGYGVVSIHRNENLTHGPTFSLLMEEVARASRILPLKFVLHPATRARLETSGWMARLCDEPGVQLLDRMGYPDFIALLLGSRLLLTDGGSNQEEAAMLGIPTLLLRRATERSDGLDNNIALSRLDREVIRTFVGEHASRRWAVRLVEGESPSSRLVDLLLAGSDGTNAGTTEAR